MKYKKQFTLYWVAILSIAWITPAVSDWGKCGWYNVGYNKSHFSNQGNWCPSGMFITQLDLDGGGYGNNNMGNYPMVGRVKCCAPIGGGGYLPVKRTPRSGGGKGDSGFATQDDINLIWLQIDEILKTLEGK